MADEAAFTPTYLTRSVKDLVAAFAQQLNLIIFN